MKKRNLTIRRIFNYVLILSLPILAPQIAGASITTSLKSSIGNFLDTAKQGAQIQVQSVSELTTNSFKNLTQSVESVKKISPAITSIAGVTDTVSDFKKNLTESSGKIVTVTGAQSASVASSIDNALEKVFGLAIEKTSNLFTLFFLDRETVMNQSENSYTIENLNSASKPTSSTQTETQTPASSNAAGAANSANSKVDDAQSAQAETGLTRSGLSFDPVIIQNLTRRVTALENRTVTGGAGSAVAANGTTTINQYVTNNYLGGGGGYSIPADSTSQTNTLIASAVAPIQQQVTTIISGGGSGNATNTFAYILATSTTATSTFAGNISVDGDLITDGSITANTFYGDGSHLTGISAGSSFSTSTTRGVFGGEGLISYNQSTGVFSFSTSSITTADITENGNLYFTDGRADTRADLRIAAATSTIRGFISSSAAGLTYTPSTGIFSLTGGYTIPTTASTTEWASKVGSQWATSGADISYAGGNVGIGTTTPSAKLTITGTAGTGDIFNIASSTQASLFKISSTGSTYFNNDAGTAGMVLLSNGTGSSPTWVATSSLGISGGGGSSQWTTTGSDIYYDTGNVAIGATTADYKLQVYDTSGGDIGYFGADAEKNLRISWNGINTYYQGDASSLVLNANGGYVGVGTTTPVSAFAVTGTSTLDGVVQLSSIAQVRYGVSNLILASSTNYTAFFAGAGAQSSVTSSGMSYNIGIGNAALSSLSSGGVNNTALGVDALKVTSTGTKNVAVGNFSLDANTFGVENTAIGYNALTALSGTSLGNTALGANALSGVGATVHYNVAIGVNAGSGMTSGNANIIIGSGLSGNGITVPLVSGSGSNKMNIGGLLWGTEVNTTNSSAISAGNIGIGSSTPSARLSIVGASGLTTDLLRIASSTQSMYFNVTAAGNVAVGSNAGTTYKFEVAGSASTTQLYLPNTTTATSGGIYFGTTRFLHNAGATNNVFLGSGSGNFTLSGNVNVGVGRDTLKALTSGTNNVAIGDSNSYILQSGSNNTSLGSYTLPFLVTGGANTAIGYNALGSVTGANNTGLGYQAGNNLTTGSANVAIGYVTAFASTTASNQLVISNIIYGTTLTGTGSTVSPGNIGIGSTTPTARLTVTGASGSANNIFTVASSTQTSLFAVTPAGNIGIGTTTPGALLHINVANISTGGTSTSPQELLRLSVFDNTTDLGVGAGGKITFFASPSNNTMASLEVANIGAGKEDADDSTPDTFLNFSTYDGSALAERMRISSDGNVGIGTVSPSYNLQVNGTAGKTGGGTWSDSSDERLKTALAPIAGNDALEKIMRINPVLFDWINPSIHGGAVESGGFTAQNILEIFPDFVTKNPCVGADCNLTGGADTYSLTLPFKFFGYLVSSIKEIAQVGGVFKENLIAWLGDATNGIGSVFVKDLKSEKVKTDQLCVGNTCVTEQQLVELLSRQYSLGGFVPSPSNNSPIPSSPSDNSDGDSNPVPPPAATTSTPSPSSTPNSDLTQESEPLPLPEPSTAVESSPEVSDVELAPSDAVPGDSN